MSSEVQNMYVIFKDLTGLFSDVSSVLVGSCACNICFLLPQLVSIGEHRLRKCVLTSTNKFSL